MVVTTIEVLAPSAGFLLVLEAFTGFGVVKYCLLCIWIAIAIPAVIASIVIEEAMPTSLHGVLSLVAEPAVNKDAERQCDWKAEQQANSELCKEFNHLSLLLFIILTIASALARAERTKTAIIAVISIRLNLINKTAFSYHSQQV